jgi:hypothetical protein
MGKGRDKRRRKVKQAESRGIVLSPLRSPGDVAPPADSASPLDPDAPVPAPIKPRPHSRSGAVAIPEPTETENALVLVGGTKK